MGLFDRLRGNAANTSAAAAGREAPKVAGSAAEANPKKKDNTFFLDADSSSTLGDVTFMRRSNTIRRTFPGNADNPGDKELVQEVASMEASTSKVSDGLPGTAPAPDGTVDLTGGIPTPVKKTFAERMTAADLQQRLKGSGIGGVNVPGAPATSARSAGSGSAATTASGQAGGKPGAIDPFKQMVKDLTG